MIPDARLTFERFVASAPTRVAVAAARAVAESPGAVYNPLYLHGASGHGKTHLLHAVGNLARELSPSRQVELVSVAELAEQLAAASGAGEGEAFLRRCRALDFIMLDDADALGGFGPVQLLLAQLLEGEEAARRQLVVAASRPPSLLDGVDERLRALLGVGFVVPLGAPDYAARLEVLRRLAAEGGDPVEPELLESLAHETEAGVVGLRAAFARVAATATTRGLAAAPFSLGDGGEFESFLTDVAHTVAQRVDPWKARLAEAIARWTAQGYRVGVLERALLLPIAPDVDGLLATYEAAVAHLRALQADARFLDPALGAHAAFGDPERVREAESLLAEAEVRLAPPPPPPETLTLTSFDAGTANANAWRIAAEAAAASGSRHNPLVIVGAAGSGRTHLAAAVLNEAAALSGGSLEGSFTTAADAIREHAAERGDGPVGRWRARHARAEALAFDDAHLAADPALQSDLRDVLAALVAGGRQVVVTLDRAPADHAALDPSLRGLLADGTVVVLQPPDDALRARLVARFAEAAGHPAPPDVVAYLAARPVSTPGELREVVRRVTAAAGDRPLTVEAARLELEPAGAAGGTRALDAFFTDREKVVWDWPDVGGRAVEELK